MEDTKKYFIQQYGTTEKCADILLKIFGDILFDDEGVYLYKDGYGIYRYAYLVDYIGETAAKNEENHENHVGKYKKSKETEKELKLRIKGFTYVSFRLPSVACLRFKTKMPISLTGRRTPKYYLCKGCK